MKKLILSLSALLVFSSCALLSPYSLTFTTREGTIINPASSTLDLAVNMDALAYISHVSCNGEDVADLLPIITDDMVPTKAHNLSLAILADQEPGSVCDVTVTAFDQTTTANSSKKIKLYVLEMPADEVADEEVDEAAGDETADTVPPIAGLGETCSGPEHISCEDGLICKRAPEDNGSEAEGTCYIPVLDGETCDDGTGCPAGETTVNTDETTKDTTTDASTDASTEESGA